MYPSKSFKKLLPKKIHFKVFLKKIFSLKRHISKKNFLKNRSLKKSIFRSFLQNFSSFPKKYIFKTENAKPKEQKLISLHIFCLLRENFSSIREKKKICYTFSYKEALFSEL